ncbi:MAG: hypothetical protein HRT37_17100 [Alteromonadaceae bacterium]|nr:hypothetical protein [Alteromonadaceae bacterium]
MPQGSAIQRIIDGEIIAGEIRTGLINANETGAGKIMTAPMLVAGNIWCQEPMASGSVVYPSYLEMQDSASRETAIYKALNFANSYSY